MDAEAVVRSGLDCEAEEEGGGVKSRGGQGLGVRPAVAREEVEER